MSLCSVWWWKFFIHLPENRTDPCGIVLGPPPTACQNLGNNDRCLYFDHHRHHEKKQMIVNLKASEAIPSVTVCRKANRSVQLFIWIFYVLTEIIFVLLSLPYAIWELNRVSKVNQGDIILQKRSVVPRPDSNLKGPTAKNMLQLFNLEKHYHQHVIMFMLTLTKKTTMIRIIFLQNHDHGEDEDNEDDEKQWNFETLLGMCEEHHGSSLGSTSFASNADVVRSKENSHLEVIVMMVATILR